MDKKTSCRTRASIWIDCFLPHTHLARLPSWQQSPEHHAKHLHKSNHFHFIFLMGRIQVDLLWQRCQLSFSHRNNQFQGHHRGAPKWHYALLQSVVLQASEAVEKIGAAVWPQKQTLPLDLLFPEGLESLLFLCQLLRKNVRQEDLHQTNRSLEKP